MFNSLLATKFSIPPLRPNLVHRPRLTAALSEAWQQNCKLILLAAPAGFGKTTLAAEWLRAQRANTAWLSLDAGDNDPARFWRYMIAAVQILDSSIGQLAQTILETGEPAPLEACVTALINDLVALPGPVILVLDEYEKIEAEAVHSSLNFFLDHLPGQVSLVILTRVDPPLALARRRSRAQLAETRSADLRFTAAEAAAFLNDVANLHLSAEDIGELTSRTEGWAAGLQLAAHSLSRQADKHAFVKTFAGDDHYIVDYLLGEVLQHQPESVKTFLFQTSILDRFNAPLCDQVTGLRNSQSILAVLEQANLFIVALDTRHQWYRYHALFAELLRWRLRQTTSPEAVGLLYRQAAQWYEEEGVAAEAVQLLIAAGDFEEVVRLLKEHALDIFYRSETRLLYHWFKALPEALLRAHPLLCALYANTIALAPPYPPASVGPAEKWLHEAETGLAGQAGQSVASAFVTTFRAYLARYRGEDPQAVVDQSLQAIDTLPVETSLGQAGSDLHFLKFRGALWNNISLTYWAAGQVGPAIQASIQARKMSELGGDLFNALSSVYLQASLARRLGQLSEAALLCQEALQSLPAPLDGGESRTPYAGAIDIVMGQVQLEWNNLEAAEQYLSRGLSLIQMTLGTTIQTEGYLALSRLKFAQDDLEGAFAALQMAEKNWAGARAMTEIQRVRLWIGQAGRCQNTEQRQEALEQVERWAGSRPFPAEAGILSPERLALARARIALCYAARFYTDGCLPRPGISKPGLAPDLQPILRFLEQQIEEASSAGWNGWLVDLYILQALAHLSSGSAAQAAGSLRRALDAAYPGGYLRAFVDEGEPICSLLLTLEDEPGEKGAYARRILAAKWNIPPAQAPRPLEPPETSPLTKPEAHLAKEALIEPLSPREMEVLRLVAAGASNADIAQQLYITRNTAKKHVINIFGKLGVSHRVEAIIRARALGLIP